MSSRRALAALAALVGIVLLASCGGVIGAMVDTTEGLNRAGYQSPHVGFKGSIDAPEVTASVSVDATPSAAAAEGAARVVWADLHERFGSLVVTVRGHGPELVHTYTFAELQSDFGARNPAWNRQTVRSSARDLGDGVLIGLLVVAVLVTGTVILVSTRRRKRRPPAPPPWMGGPPGGAPPGGARPGEGTWGAPGSGGHTWGPPGQTGGWGAPAPPS